MTQRRLPLLIVLLAAIAGTVLTGCEISFVGDAARQSLSSFVIDVFSTAVDATINP